MNRLFTLLCLAMLFSVPVAVYAQTTFTSSQNQNKNEAVTSSTDLEAAQALENGFGLTPEDFGGAIGPDGLPLTKEELEALQKLRSGEQDPGFTQQKNDPSKQIFKGADKKNNRFEAPRTHRMYEDTRY